MSFSGNCNSNRQSREGSQRPPAAEKQKERQEWEGLSSEVPPKYRVKPQRQKDGLGSLSFARATLVAQS